MTQHGTHETAPHAFVKAVHGVRYQVKAGSRSMPDGQLQEPGGWNRVVLKVVDLTGFIIELKKAGLRFRNEIETGPGGRQIQVEDPDGNPIELFEPAR